MEVKIGVADSSRELVLTSSQSPDEVETLITDALGDKQGLLTLVDDKGRRYVVPTGRIAYIEIGPSEARRVGFAVNG
ncbi:MULTISPECIES: DUF3107 domain-containing protein [Actinoalloteichus]|uniref:DUF3107 family protein n=1 Tax=Actinoalloteichus fjordicus TaxID=1612552 RepID=A0AAC9LAF1_9PSEU|nr:MULTISPECIES: DUF3107 domain-containing protein [Actinoalloteichus]APU13022.1 putative DUF3107 family protein [Actinoalloteichus fjordicus]APU18995.1 putative DUF3107 family protein [Actinoalloteichus sp. GBA129-24]